jgi:hypothetical protein
MVASQQQQVQHSDWTAIYTRRQRASLPDAREETEATRSAIERINKSVDDKSPESHQSLAAGKLFEIANELPSAETAYRRALSAEPKLHEAAARLMVVLGNQRRFDEATKIGHELLLAVPDAVFKSLVYEGPLSLCTLLGDLYRLSGRPSIAASMYREGARLEHGTPYAVNQAVITMAQDGRAKEAVQFAAGYSQSWKSEVLQGIIRLGNETNDLLPIIREVALRANVGRMEAMLVNPLDMVTQPVA